VSRYLEYDNDDRGKRLVGLGSGLGVVIDLFGR
jgi:hypothetical protein